MHPSGEKTTSEVDGPQHVVGYRHNVAEQCEPLGLVVLDPARQQSPPSALITTAW